MRDILELRARAILCLSKIPPCSFAYHTAAEPRAVSPQLIRIQIGAWAFTASRDREGAGSLPVRPTYESFWIRITGRLSWQAQGSI